MNTIVKQVATHIVAVGIGVTLGVTFSRKRRKLERSILYTEEPLGDSLDVVSDTVDTVQDNDPMPIGVYFIDRDEYEMLALDYQVVNLTYWSDDNLFSGEDYEIVDPLPEALANVDLRGLLNGSDEFPTVVYLVDYSNTVTYSVEEREGHYAEIVLGFEYNTAFNDEYDFDNEDVFWKKDGKKKKKPRKMKDDD